MKCPFCNQRNLKVLESRTSKESKIRRRRLCLNCDGRFTTYEIIEAMNPRIIKKDKTIQNFDRDKILKGIIKACEKRPVSSEKIDQITQIIENNIRKKGKKDIKSSLIGNLVMNKLKKIDKVAYIRFASVYRDFKDVDTFKEEIKRLRI
jgi:transcriptional repressor NrdR